MVRDRHLILLVSCIFSISSVLLATSFKTAPMLACLAGVAGANLILAAGLRRSEALARPIQGRWLLLCVLLGLLLAALGGEGHFFFSKDDWLIRDAVLADLVSRWLPVPYAINADVSLLRAPLGMFLLPAAFGRMFGLGAAHFAQLAQSGAILGGVFYVVTLVWPRRRLLFLGLFIAFAGVDIVPILIKTQGEWIPRYLAFWVDGMYYPANLSLIFWTPNHAFPGFWFAALVALYIRREVDLAGLAAASAPLALWSPITLAGAALLFVLLALRDLRALLTPRFALACASAAAFAPILVYLVTAADSAPHGWRIAEDGVAEIYPIFLIFSLTQAVVLALFMRRIEPEMRYPLLASTLLLALIPCYSIGYMSDFSQRGSIVPHCILAFGFNALLIDLCETGWRSLREKALEPRIAFGAASALVIFLAASVTPALELWDSIVTPRYAASDCNLLTSNAKLSGPKYFATYLAPAASFPDWLIRSAEAKEPLAIEQRSCWPDRVFGERKFNYMKPEYLIWLRRPPEVTAQR